jgi:hypothetical protein
MSVALGTKVIDCAFGELNLLIKLVKLAMAGTNIHIREYNQARDIRNKFPQKV